MHLFGEISEKLSVHGFSRTAEQCHTRIKRLKTNYWQCRDGMRSGGGESRGSLWKTGKIITVSYFCRFVRSASGNDKVNFKFFDLMEQILDKRPSTSTAAAAAVVADPIEISEDSNGDSVTETGKAQKIGSRI